MIINIQRQFTLGIPCHSLGNSLYNSPTPVRRQTLHSHECIFPERLRKTHSGQLPILQGSPSLDLPNDVPPPARHKVANNILGILYHYLSTVNLKQCALTLSTFNSDTSTSIFARCHGVWPGVAPLPLGGSSFGVFRGFKFNSRNLKWLFQL